ncbi:hypothetical protein FB451DRAFT_1186656 [Mycena latifolia]|nr:hypothetical protein FB451DRAFT_1186656 [Mycena latifolia]
MSVRAVSCSLSPLAMNLSQILASISGRKARNCSRTEVNEGDAEVAPSPNRLDAAHTGRNVLTLALQTLSKQVSTNGQGLIQLATRIDRLTPIISEISSSNPEQNIVAEALQRELESMTKDLNNTRSQGKLEQFFNTTDNDSALTQHNTALAEIIADSTFATVNEVLKSLRALEDSKSLEAAALAQSQMVMGEITGGFGGRGGIGHIGGEGGDGDGPNVEISPERCWKIGTFPVRFCLQEAQVALVVQAFMLAERGEGAKLQ